MDNGEVIPVWKKDNASKITLVAMLFGGAPCLVPDAEAFIRKNPSAKRGNSSSRRQTKLDGFIHRGGSGRIRSKSRFDFGTLRMYPLGLQKPVTARTV
ncbi:hypothetical protein M407DRAFT_246124 [Tulasnella calospora MUT 4182]|uniref:Uncharacterized protein n=1 Tax=Tulasnella calospora MUT 4182 TaxID=1051891 RepID=A0A0C3LDN6_9AGAM|nr:hypothetical protein M407DRAFT_246124 [Tulasnella calospora MUT 4182]